jgi:hypothetical protein
LFAPGAERLTRALQLLVYLSRIDKRILLRSVRTAFMRHLFTGQNVDEHIRQRKLAADTNEKATSSSHCSPLAAMLVASTITAPDAISHTTLIQVGARLLGLSAALRAY